MKIGIDISQIVYQTGVSRYTAELVKHLVKLDKSNQYLLYAGSIRCRSYLKSFIQSLGSVRISSQITFLSPKLINLAWNYWRILPPPNCDVFHASNWALPKLKAKLITTIHDLTFLKYPKEHLPYYISVHTQHLKLAKKYASKIIAVSESTKKDLIAEGFNPDKIKVIYEAADSIFKPTDPRPVKAKYKLTKPYYLSVGTLEPRKNLKRLIQAFQVLNNPRRELVIAGKFGWGEPIIKSKNVRILGFVPNEDLAGLYSGALSFIYPSLYEGFGLPVLEAMACGCPVIISNTSSLPEIGGQAALYVNPLKLNDLIQAMKIVSKLNLSQRSLQQSKKFSWEKTTKETLAVYQEAVQC